MATNTHLFHGSRLKIQWANQHIDYLESVFASYLQTDFCKLRIDTDPRDGNQALALASIKHLPVNVPLSLGDIVHNLRSSLDYVTSQLIGTDNDRISFPMTKERDKLAESGAMRKVREFSPDLADFILDKIAAYDTGHPSIWSVGRLNNIDKHKLLVPVINVQSISGIDAINERNNIRMTDCTFSVSQGGVCRAISLPPPVKITRYGKPTAKITFGKGQPLEGQMIIPALRDMSKITLQTVEAVEAFWLGQKPKG